MEIKIRENLIITSVVRPVYNSAGTIDCTITLNGDELQFTASPDDFEAHGRLIYEACINGDFGEIQPYIPPPEPTMTPDVAEAKKAALMHEATTAIGPLEDAVELGIATDDEQALYKAWRTYRVEVSRVDITKVPDIEWPTPPVTTN